MNTQARLWILLAGMAVLLGRTESLRGSALVAELKAKAKAALLNPTETVEEVVTVEGDAAGNTTSASNVTVTKTKSLLTGNPQKDYIYDPNLPRELNGYNLSSYPFYNGVPEDINFKCDDLHDGFYASVPHKCQVYHHCLFGTRYDFLCANYTAFDQRTFICHFVSEVDCDNSPKYFQRNEALYKAQSTSPPIVLVTTTTTTTTMAPTAVSQRPRRRRPYRRRRPVYEYYYDDQYDDEEYYDDDPPPPPRRKSNRKHRPQGGHYDDEDDYYESGRRENSRSESSRSENSRSNGPSRSENSRGDDGGDSSKEPKSTVRVSGPAAGTVYDRPRVPPKIRRPVPIHERDKYDYTKKSTDVTPSPTDNSKKANKPQNKHEADEDDYYDDEYEDEYVKPSPPKRGKTGSDHASGSGEKINSRRVNGRHRPRQHSRRRPERYDDDYEEDRPVRPRKRQRHEETSHMGRENRGGNRGHSRDEPDPVPAERPGFISSGRFSSGSRKRNEDERSQPSNKKSVTRPIYDDDEEEEEYYDDEEEDVQDDEVNRRIHKPSNSNGNNGRNSNDYDADNERRSNKKQSVDTSSSKPTSKNNVNYQPAGNHQLESTKNENVKSINRSRPNTASSSRDHLDSECKRRSCEEDYSDYSTEDLKEEKPKGVEIQKPDSEKENQNYNNERERLFSSRFRDSLTESKPKQQNFEPSGQGRPPSYQNHRGSQNTESQQRLKQTSRTKPKSDDTFTQKPVTPTNSVTLSPESSDESTAGKYSNFRSKGRVVPPTPLLDNYKSVSTTEKALEVPNNNQETEHEYFDSDGQVNSSTEKLVSPRPFSGIARRPGKLTTENTPLEDSSVSTKSPVTGLNYRQPSLVSEEDFKNTRKQGNFAQNYRRVKVDPSHFGTGDYDQTKQSNIGNNFRRPNKPLEEIKSEEVSYEKESQEDTSQTEGNERMEEKSPLPDKTQHGGPGYGGAYRRVKISAISTPAPEPEVSTSTNESPQSLQGTPVSNPVNSYKRPFLVARPLSNFPVVVEDSTKNTLALNGPFRRPAKQKIPGSDSSLAVDSYNLPSAAVGNSESYNLEPDSSINVRPGLGYFLPKRGKVRIDENSPRGLEQFPKEVTINQEERFSKQSPKIEITAPGPSAPDMDIATVKSNYKNEYNSGHPGFTLDIPEEEYDVTLNDALQPSTLHPTRSLVDYPQTRLKTRDYQSNIGRSPEYRGRVSYLLPAASQQYITRIQSVFAPEKQEENPITARYTSDKGSKKTSAVEQEEYEAVVLTAPADQWMNQRRNRPTEWYW